MKLLRSLGLLLCLAPFWVLGGPAHGAQASGNGKAAVAQDKATKASAEPVRKKASTQRKVPAKTSTSGKRKAGAKPRIDLSLPVELVKDLKPQVSGEPLARKPLLPSMFTEKPATDSPFQLNGRLISNEMQLQLRNDSRRDVEGAAIDFEFKQ
ncbi:hypothetical protein ACYU03_17350 [Pseudomonas sp. X10]